jgi:hypothetical protein
MVYYNTDVQYDLLFASPFFSRRSLSPNVSIGDGLPFVSLFSEGEACPRMFLSGMVCHLFPFFSEGEACPRMFLSGMVCHLFPFFSQGEACPRMFLSGMTHRKQDDRRLRLSWAGEILMSVVRQISQTILYASNGAGYCQRCSEPPLCPWLVNINFHYCILQGDMLFETRNIMAMSNHRNRCS